MPVGGAVQPKDDAVAQCVVDVVDEGDRHEEEDNEDPAVVHQHILETAVLQPGQGDEEGRQHHRHDRPHFTHLVKHRRG